jgi:hypothetical protein
MAEVFQNDQLFTDENTIIFNGTTYSFNIGIINTDQRYREIKPAAIKSLVLEDQIHNTFHRGYMIVDNSFGALERNIESSPPASSPQYYTPLSQQQNKGFIFKGDSRDIVSIDIMPKLTDGPFTTDDDDDASKLFRITLDMAVYNTEEILTEEPGRKYIKLYLWDLYYELLKEKNVAFSTANILSSQDINDLSNSQRGVRTGTVLKEFLKTAFDPNDGYPVSIDEQNFEEGSTPLFFSSPANYKGIDSVEYILSRHVSSPDNDFDPAFLELERYPRQFILKSLKSHFNGAYDRGSLLDDQGGNDFLETYKIGGYDNNSTVIPVLKVNYGPKYALFLEKLATISNFSFENMPGYFSQDKLTSIDVHSYNYEDKQFSIESYRNDITESMAVYKKNYVDSMKGENGNPPAANFIPGAYRTLRKNIQNVFSVVDNVENQRLAFGRNDFLFNSIFMNNIINFKVLGSSHRQSGRFIAIERDDAVATSDFDNKLLGIYFVVEVKHNFIDGEYYNELRCAKTYNFKDIFINKDSV